ncbi:MAG TPA: hypothetical protein VFN29_11685 [Chiayiivirga sp.]|nr:hypothetical protein [Chiayiivirga sp.]
MNGIARLGMDGAKNVFALHGVDAAGNPVLVRPNVTRPPLARTKARRNAEYTNLIIPIPQPTPCPSLPKILRNKQAFVERSLLHWVTRKAEAAQLAALYENAASAVFHGSNDHGLAEPWG